MSQYHIPLLEMVQIKEIRPFLTGLSKNRIIMAYASYNILWESVIT